MSSLSLKPFQAVKFSKSGIAKALKAAGNLVAETKYDGIRGLTSIRPSATVYAFADVYSRSDKKFNSMATFGQQLGSEAMRVFLNDFIFPNGLWLDGELMIKGKTFQESSGIIRANKQISLEHLTYVIYDVLPFEALEGVNEYDVPYIVRRTHIEVTVTRLKEFFPQVDWVLAEATDVFDMETLESIYETKRAEGNEGLIIKDPFAPYRRGKKSGYWKMKPEDVVDGEVIDINWGTKGLSNQGLIIGFQVLLEDGIVCNANGLTQLQMEDYTREILLHGDEFFNGFAVQVKFMERTDDGGLRHPSFDGFRGTIDNPTQKV